jgi:hypothetical protein
VYARMVSVQIKHTDLRTTAEDPLGPQPAARPEQTRSGLLDLGV